MKRLICIFISLTLLFALLITLSACRDPFIKSGSFETTYDGVTLEVKNIDYTGEYIQLDCEWRNLTLNEVTYAAEYTVERFDGEDWINCMNADISFIEIAYVLAPLSTQDKSYSMRYVDISKNGTYRIRTACFVRELDDSVTRCTLFATFTVENERTAFGYHKLDYHLVGTGFVDDPKPYYKEGETVTLKIYKIMDVDFSLFVNSVELESELEGDDYWQYSFIMPSGPVVISSAIEDGFID